MESGGYAAKLGDRYERRWIARQLLLLLQERLRAVTVEAVGDDEAGVDVWLDLLDGTRDAQQCKAENNLNKEWTLADLKHRGVLDYAKAQLERDPRITFTFVSSVPATDLRDLARSARDSVGDAEGFFQHQVEGRSKNTVKAFRSLCGYWGFDSDEPEDRAKAYFLLKRIAVHIFADDRESREELRLMAQVSVEGNPDSVISALADYGVSEGNLRRCLSTQDVWNELTRLNLPPRRLSSDPRLTVRIKEINEEFSESIRPTLVSGNLIHRSETGDLLSFLEDGRSGGMVILHGAAGRGKSGVLYEFTQELETREVPYLSIRLDRKTIRGSARQFGMDIGLRESPVRCLSEIAAGRRCVLILDQLDALRWTSRHAAEGLDVCKEMLREVVALRSLGMDITAVLCCRTFDLEHDPQIKSWLEKKVLSAVKISVGDITDTIVENVVRALQVDYERLSNRQRELLRTINNLAIWSEIVNSEQRSPDFGSQTQLLRAYWHNRFRLLEAAGVSAADRTELLDRLIDHMEASASISAPARILEQNQTISTELQSLGIVRISGRAVTFAHQTHLDYLIAERALQKLSSEPNAILNWLGDRSRMSLLRREQLRQLLLLLVDEDPPRFLATIQAIVESPDVRFHMKQLTLEVIGQVKPDEDIVAFTISLHAKDEWREHIEGEVFSSGPEYCAELAKGGYLNKWLASNEKSKQRLALWILRRNVDTCVDVVVRQCAPLLDRGDDWPARVEAILGINVVSDPSDIFNLRLKCARLGAAPRHVPWQELVEHKPRRALFLFAAILDGEFRSHNEQSVRTCGYSGKEDPTLLTVKSAAKHHPTLACKLLGPLFSKFVHRSFAPIRKQFLEDGSRYRRPNERDKTPASLSRVLHISLAALAEAEPREFFRLVRKLEKLPGRLTRKLLVEAHAHLPNEYADDSLAWLLSDRRRLSCGSRRKEHRWMPAQRLIQSVSPHCSDTMFRDLEVTLLHYNDPDEIRRSKADLRYVRDGHYWNCMGAAQYHLLPALCNRRRSIETIGRIGVLQRKFRPLGKSFFLQHSSHGGFVRSPLNRSRINHLSDNAWLKLITNDKVGSREHDRKVTYLENSVIEVSVEQFARDLTTAALCDPDRFARLALRIPDSAPPKYLSAILYAMDRENAPSEVPEDRRSTWVPASAGSVQALLERPLNLSDQEQAMGFCRILSNRDDIEITATIIQRLCYCCRHQDPPDNALHIRCDVAAAECDVDDLEQNAINCVRGVAARAISHILYDRQDLLPQFLSTVADLLDDPHPVVRVAAIAICLPVWNLDRSLSVSLFSRAVAGDLRVAASRTARHFFNYSIPQFEEQLGPIVEQMAKSTNPEVSEGGAGEIAARWVFYGIFDDILSDCVKGTLAQRKGVTESFVQLAHKEEHSSKCLPFLAQLANDEAEEVRKVVNVLFRYDQVLEAPGFPEFLQKYIQTQSFRDDPSDLVDALNDRKSRLSDLSEIVLTVSFAFLEAWNSNERQTDQRGWAASHYLVPLTLRLYEMATNEVDESIRTRCLDFWDELLRLRIASGSELFKSSGN